MKPTASAAAPVRKEARGRDSDTGVLVVLIVLGVILGVLVGAFSASLLCLDKGFHVAMFAGGLAGAFAVIQATSTSTSSAAALSLAAYAIWVSGLAIYDGVLEGAMAGFACAVVCAVVVAVGCYLASQTHMEVNYRMEGTFEQLSLPFYGGLVGSWAGVITAVLLYNGARFSGLLYVEEAQVLMFAGALEGAFAGIRATSPDGEVAFWRACVVFVIWLSVFAIDMGVLVGAAAGFISAVSLMVVVYFATTVW